jgi:soluble lytic murein transglycosylase-like protein
MKFLFLILFNLAIGNDIETIIKLKAVKYGVDPKLAVAIAKTESSLNPNAIGQLGEVGLFQLRPEFHDVRKGDIKHNITISMKYLSYLEKRCKPKYNDAWFVCFNTGANRRNPIKNPTEFKYYKKVMSYYAGIK